MPKISVIIPVWNMADSIGDCLSALAKQTFTDFEVIVVDNGSSDETQSVALEHYGERPFRLIQELEKGSYVARNRGWRASSSEIIAFTDADCQPAPDWLARAVAALEHNPDAGVLTGPVELYPLGERSVALYELRESFLGCAKDVQNGGCVTANWISPRHVIAGLSGLETI